MISFIKGEVVKKGLDYIILENNNMGYFINTSLNTLNNLSEGEKACIFTYLHIREDILQLYGFLSVEEIDMFKKLITVNGVGPKAGLAVLSTYDVNTVKAIILKDDAVKMSKVPGVGKKTASKIILELKDKVGKLDNINHDDEYFDEIKIIDDKNEISDLIDALTSLGFNQFEAKKVLDEIDIKNKSENEIIKEALKKIKVG
ncbi:MAG: Holliday junction ATP-dependent helicase ruvA [Bacillota bacterium]|jgi:Holliday junction DNA helicase RuvA|nr:Holliday junction ATP-dependent helicase ruvA [Bacillota bacterium]